MHVNGLKRPRPDSMVQAEDYDSPSSKRSVSQEVEDRDSRSTARDSDDLNSETAQLDRMELESQIAAQSSRPSATQQKNAIMPLMSHSIAPGSKIYIVKRSWYRTWQSAVLESADEKGEQAISIDEIPPIDNTNMVDSTGRLIDVPYVDQNIVLATEEVYQQWQAWYGENEPAVMRRAIRREGDTVGQVEYYPPRFHIARVVDERPAMEVYSNFELSVVEDLARLKAYLQRDLRVPSDGMRIWRYTPSQRPPQSAVYTSNMAADLALRSVLAKDIPNSTATFEKLDTSDTSLNLIDAGLDEPDIFLAVESQDQDGDWLVREGGDQAEQASGKPSFGNGFFETKTAPLGNTLQPKYKSRDGAPIVSGPPTASTSTLPTSRIATRSQTGSSTRAPGLTGLHNLGNTCFMDSALQCLSNTPELTKYFTSDAWRQELNPDNPLGMDGKVAMAFAEVIQRLWSGTLSAYSPREFKQTIGRFRPMFVGWSQQDSQELIAFLLDGLHEDLNRIRKKPYVELPDWEGEPTPERMYAHAARMWDLYRKRNDSVMVDLFFGQFRSTLTCLECGKVSYKFDEFSSVTLSLPKKPLPMTWHCIPLDPSKARTDIVLEMPTDGTFRDVRLRVASLLGLDPKRLVGFETYSGRVWKWFTDSHALSDIQKSDVAIVLELPFEWSFYNPPREKRRLTVAERDAEDGKIFVPVGAVKLAANALSRTIGNRDKVGWPLVLALRADEALSYDAVYAAIVRQAARFSRKGDEMFELDETDSEDETTRKLAPGMSPSLPPKDAIPKAGLFKIVVQDRSADPVPAEEYRESKGSPLEKRIAARASEKRPQGSIPGAFPASSEDGATPMQLNRVQDQVSEAAEATTTSVDPPMPVISTGDSLFIEWTAAAWKMFFDNDLSLFEDFAKFEDPAIAKNAEDRKTRPLSLDSCLTEFCKPERLGEDNPWKCPVCNKLQENTSKQMDLWKVPDILVIHLKRFSKGGSYWQKTSDNVDFPLENWDLTDRVEGRRIANQLKKTREGRELLGADFEDKPLLYDLFAVDNHYGGMGGGHYTAYAKNEGTGRWYHFDDSTVTELRSPEDVKTSAAYLLFYRRQSDKGLGSLKTEEVIQEAIMSRSVSSMGDERHADAVGEINGKSTFNKAYGLLTPPDEPDIAPGGFIPTAHPSSPARSNSWSHLPDVGRRASTASDEANAGSEDEGVGHTLVADGWQQVTANSEADDDLPDAAAEALAAYEPSQKRRITSTLRSSAASPAPSANKFSDVDLTHAPIDPQLRNPPDGEKDDFVHVTGAPI